MKEKRGLETMLVHAGEPRPRIARAVVTPIFQSSTFAMDGDVGHQDLQYARLSNTPSHQALHEKLAAVEGGEAALVTASGMAAISSVLLSLLRPGDHVVAVEGLYGTTHDLLVHDLSELGIEHTFVAGDDPGAWERAWRPRTKVFYTETMTNPLLRVADLPGIAAFARARGATSVIDNTFASPVQFRPIGHGFDVVVHSATKYLNGHSDVIAGAVIGRASLVASAKRKLDRLGGSLDPHACFLLHRGLRTLSIRVRHQAQTAAALARALEAHPGVARVHHPGLPSHADHDRARALLTGFGGMLSFEPRGGLEAASRFLGRLVLGVDAPSLGGPETLVTLPSRTSHKGLDPVVRRSLGIADELVRVSVGLETAEDLVADFAQALEP
ncbi:MAG: aminotransferase class I/II-fold pyridoxal phosphate-dependent enzyme [Myxococcales bacterium]|nr:aminotransferase class I/II-fold pyridoxal phosphate-dependent enzyme [Myxococcales bacterium]